MPMYSGRPAVNDGNSVSSHYSKTCESTALEALAGHCHDSIWLQEVSNTCHWLSDAVLQCQGTSKQRRLRTEGLRLVWIEGLHDVYKGMVKHQLIDVSAYIIFASCT